MLAPSSSHSKSRTILICGLASLRWPLHRPTHRPRDATNIRVIINPMADGVYVNHAKLSGGACQITRL